MQEWAILPAMNLTATDVPNDSYKHPMLSWREHDNAFTSCIFLRRHSYAWSLVLSILFTKISRNSSIFSIISLVIRMELRFV